MQDSTIYLAATIYLRAASYIRTYGWQVTGMGVHGGPRCSMGAVSSAYPKKKWDRDLSQIMYSSLYDELDGMTLTAFNYKYRDGEKVAKLYERVARNLLQTLSVNLDFLTNDLTINSMTTSI